MNCLKTKSDIKQNLLESIELKPFSFEICIDKSDKKSNIVNEKPPWQFFLDTHTNRSDIGWWKKQCVNKKSKCCF